MFGGGFGNGGANGGGGGGAFGSSGNGGGGAFGSPFGAAAQQGGGQRKGAFGAGTAGGGTFGGGGSPNAFGSGGGFGSGSAFGSKGGGGVGGGDSSQKKKRISNKQGSRGGGGAFGAPTVFGAAGMAGGGALGGGAFAAPQAQGKQPSPGKQQVRMKRTSDDRQGRQQHQQFRQPKQQQQQQQQQKAFGGSSHTFGGGGSAFGGSSNTFGGGVGGGGGGNVLSGAAVSGTFGASSNTSGFGGAMDVSMKKQQRQNGGIGRGRNKQSDSMSVSSGSSFLSRDPMEGTTGGAGKKGKGEKNGKGGKGGKGERGGKGKAGGGAEARNSGKGGGGGKGNKGTGKGSGGKGSGGKGSGGKGSDGKGSGGKGSGGKGNSGKGSEGKGSGGKGSVKSCSFGRNCTRKSCWYLHPDGREIDESMDPTENDEADDGEEEEEEEADSSVMFTTTGLDSAGSGVPPQQARRASLLSRLGERPLAVSDNTPTSSVGQFVSAGAGAFSVGDTVLALFAGDGLWYNATVQKIHPNGTCDIRYNDFEGDPGEFETGKPVDEMREGDDSDNYHEAEQGDAGDKEEDGEDQDDDEEEEEEEEDPSNPWSVGNLGGAIYGTEDNADNDGSDDEYGSGGQTVLRPGATVGISKPLHDDEDSMSAARAAKRAGRFAVGLPSINPKPSLSASSATPAPRAGANRRLPNGVLTDMHYEERRHDHWEKNSELFGLRWQDVTVKIHKRSEAGHIANMEQIRTDATLGKVVEFLLTKVVDADTKPDKRVLHNFMESRMYLRPPNSLDMWLYVEDRMRAVTVDYMEQHYIYGERCSTTCIDNYEKIARFNIGMYMELQGFESRTPDRKEPTLFTTYNENCDKRVTETLSHLRGLYNHALESNDPQLLSEHMQQCMGYMILWNMDESAGSWLSGFIYEISMHDRRHGMGICSSPPIVFALAVVAARRRRDFAGFFALMRAAPYLEACIMYKYAVGLRSKGMLGADSMRSHAIRAFYDALAARKFESKVPVETLTRILCCDDDEETKQLLEDHGLACEVASAKFDDTASEQTLHMVAIFTKSTKGGAYRFDGDPYSRDGNVGIEGSMKRLKPSLLILRKRGVARDANGMLVPLSGSGFVGRGNVCRGTFDRDRQISALATPVASSICAMAGRLAGSAALFGGPTKSSPVDSMVRYTLSKPSKISTLSDGRLGTSESSTAAAQRRDAQQRAKEEQLRVRLSEEVGKKRAAEVAESELRKKRAELQAAERMRVQEEETRERAAAAAAAAAAAELEEKRKDEAKAEKAAATRALKEAEALRKEQEAQRLQREAEERRRRVQEQERLRATKEKEEKVRRDAQLKRQRRLSLWLSWKIKVSRGVNLTRCGTMALHLATRRRREAIAIRTLALNRWHRACRMEEERRERARRRLELIRSTIIGLDVNRALEPLFPGASDTALVLSSTVMTQPQLQHKVSSLQSPQQLELVRRSMEYGGNAEDGSAVTRRLPAPLPLAALVGHSLLAATAESWDHHCKTMQAIDRGQRRLAAALAAGSSTNDVQAPSVSAPTEWSHQNPPTTFWKLLLVPVPPDAKLRREQQMQLGWSATPRAVVDWAKFKLTPAMGLSMRQRAERMGSLQRMQGVSRQSTYSTNTCTAAARAAAGVLALQLTSAAVLRNEIQSGRGLGLNIGDDDDDDGDDENEGDSAGVKGVQDTDDFDVDGGLKRIAEDPSTQLPPLCELCGELALCVRESPMPDATSLHNSSLLEDMAMHGASAVVMTLEQAPLEGYFSGEGDCHEAKQIRDVVQSMIDKAIDHGQSAEFPLLVIIPVGTEEEFDQFRESRLARQLSLDDLPRASTTGGGILTWRILCVPVSSGPASAVIDSFASPPFARAIQWLAANTPPAKIVCAQSLSDAVGQAVSASLATSTVDANKVSSDSSQYGHALSVVNGMVDALRSSLDATLRDVVRPARVSSVELEGSWWPPSEFRLPPSRPASIAVPPAPMPDIVGVFGVPGAAVHVDGSHHILVSGSLDSPTTSAKSTLLPMDWNSSGRCNILKSCLRGLALPRWSEDLVKLIGEVWLAAFSARCSAEPNLPGTLEAYLCAAIRTASSARLTAFPEAALNVKAAAGAVAIMSIVQQSGEECRSQMYPTSVTSVPPSVWNGLASCMLQVIVSQCLAVVVDATPVDNRIIFRSSWHALDQMRAFEPEYAKAPDLHSFEPPSSLLAAVSQSVDATKRCARGDNIMAVMTAMVNSTKRMRIGSLSSSSTPASSAFASIMPLSSRNPKSKRAALGFLHANAPAALARGRNSNVLSRGMRRPFVKYGQVTHTNTNSPSLGETTAAIIATARTRLPSTTTNKRARADQDCSDTVDQPQPQREAHREKRRIKGADGISVDLTTPLRYQAEQEAAASAAFEDQLRALSTI